MTTYLAFVKMVFWLKVSLGTLVLLDNTGNKDEQATAIINMSIVMLVLVSCTEALGMRYGRKKTVTSQQGALDYYGCLGHGCAVVLEVLFDNSSEDVVINYNGKQHTHKEKQHSGWGLPEKTKMVREDPM